MLSKSHVMPAVPAKDLARARRFYEDVLGLKPIETAPGGVFYGALDSMLLLYPSSFAGTNQATTMGFDVHDLAATVAELKGKGVKFEEYDMPGLKTEHGIATIGDIKAAWFKDTEGNIISLTHRAKPVAWPHG